MWIPPVSERKRERERAGAWAAAERARERERVGADWAGFVPLVRTRARPGWAGSAARSGFSLFFVLYFFFISFLI